MSVERVVVSFLVLGVALALAIALMPIVGSVAVFLVAIIGAAIFLVKGLRDLRTYSGPRASPAAQVDEHLRARAARRERSRPATITRLPPRQPTKGASSPSGPSRDGGL